jgi:hypothetical protein
MATVAIMGHYVFYSSRLQHLLLVPFVAFLSIAFALAHFVFFFFLLRGCRKKVICWNYVSSFLSELRIFLFVFPNAQAVVASEKLFSQDA